MSTKSPQSTRPLRLFARQRSFEHGQARLVRLPGATIDIAEHRPGWRWSTDVKPHVDTESCQVHHHIAFVVSGRFRVRMDDGRELPRSRWRPRRERGSRCLVLGDEPCATIDFIPTGAGFPAID